MNRILALFVILFTFLGSLATASFAYFALFTPVYAITDPLSVPNNKFGIHIISATPDEINPAATLVNSNGGDWGYVTLLIESKDRNHDKWQRVFNELRIAHLIPIVRIATAPDGGTWKKPYEGEEEAWAGFLNNLIWPIKNRYVVIYNEPNQAHEWGGVVDPKDYAKTLSKTIDVLKKTHEDFFVMNGGFDASAPNQPPNFEDEQIFIKEMNETVPGIFNKLDGWVSHSYPNPGFVGSPDDSGKGTIRTWYWELQLLRSIGVSKNLPVFITETGWKHAEGQVYDRTLPSADSVATYLEKAFKSTWNNSRIVAVTPFLLNYQEAPFDHFSFKRYTGSPQNTKILGAAYPQYYNSYEKIASLQKLTGFPVQEAKAKLSKGEIYKSLVAGETYTIPITFQNIGQSIWNDNGEVKLSPLEGGIELNIDEAKITGKIEPGQSATFNIKLTAPQSGTQKVVLQLFNGDEQFQSAPFEFYSEIKTPVILQVKAALGWKKLFGGDYILAVKDHIANTEKTVTLSDSGLSRQLEERYLLPGYKFQFILSRPHYKSVILERPVNSGVNLLDFGTLQPDLPSTLLDPIEFWKLLPFSS